MSEPWKVPTRKKAAWFWIRSRWLIARRSAFNLIDGNHCAWGKSIELAQERIIARVASTLWDETRPDEFMLLAGKVENLRIAARALNGTVVPSMGIFSFWRQLGRPSRWRGYVRGREVREGCVIPTIAGGICQLSNAIALCAQRAGFELVERHAHSAAGGDAGQGDATVFWNYVDLRIRAPVSWRIEVALTDRHLVLTIRAGKPHSIQKDERETPLSSGNQSVPKPSLWMARGCITCDELNCFRHKPELRHHQETTAWLLDAVVPEFVSYLKLKKYSIDRIQSLSPRHVVRWLSRRRFVDPWSREGATGQDRVNWIVLMPVWRSWLLRRARRSQGRRQVAVMKAAQWMARTYARRLRPEHTHLVVDQSLLPYLYQAGVLGGRTYEVLALSLPMCEIHHRLDEAVQAGSANLATLTDFRADSRWVDAEFQAMLSARRIVTPHREVADYWRVRNAPHVEKLPWNGQEKISRGALKSDVPVIVFAASALARKGAYEAASALQGIRCRLLVLGTPSDDSWLWRNIAVEHVGWHPESWLPRADLVILPAYIEHSPRAVLLAMAAGIPAIVTPACGLRDERGVMLVQAGDVQALRSAIMALVHNGAKLESAAPTSQDSDD